MRGSRRPRFFSPGLERHPGGVVYSPASGVGSEGLLTSMGVGSEGLAESYLAAVHLKMELEGALAGSVVKARLGVLKACVGLAGVPGSPDC